MIRNLTRDAVVASAPRLANTIWWRMRGLIGRDFSAFDALVFHHCGSIHTCFMSYPIDVLFLDRDLRVVGIRSALRPWRLAGVWRGQTVVEMAAGTLPQHGTTVGDLLVLDNLSTS